MRYTVCVDGVTYTVDVETRAERPEIQNAAEPGGRADTWPEAKQPQPVTSPDISPQPDRPLEMHKVQAPMPGRVSSVQTVVGGAVKSGDLLFVLEAMKMENEIRAPRAGVVIEIHTTEGALVHTGDILAVLD